MSGNTLKDLFLAQLQDIYYAEKQIYKTLPKMQEAATMQPLKDAFGKHREQTQEHISRLEEVFKMVGSAPKAKTCEAIDGIIAEGKETIEKFGGGPAIDTGLIAAGEAVEHYEMARYGALAAWAKQLDMPDAEKLLNLTRKEEVDTEQLLIKIGARNADKKAA
jgi:ferritin-like metal-binding protein YciE